MSTMLTVFFDNILPIFLVAGMGFAFRRLAKIEVKPIARLTFYIFSPCLVFNSLVSSEIALAEVGRLVLFAMSSISTMAVLGFLVSRILRLSRVHTILLVIAVMAPNAGNYGLSLNQLRYGDEGLALALPYFFAQAILIYTVGVFIASLGKASWRDSIRGMTRLPVIYAILSALFVFALDIQLPSALSSGISIASRGAIPVMLIVLGMQMANVTEFTDLKIALPAVFMRLVVGTLVAFVLASLFGLKGIGFNTSILQASMPTAVATTILATEYDILPKAMTTIVFISTILSPITIALTILLLGL